MFDALEIYLLMMSSTLVLLQIQFILFMRQYFIVYRQLDNLSIMVFRLVLESVVGSLLY
jgi:hypothetical protein